MHTHLLGDMAYLDNLLLAVRKVNDNLAQVRKIIAEQKAAAEAVKAGKFDRRHGRNIAGFVNGCSRLLDLSGGIGFVALRAHALKPEVSVLVQDDRAALIAYGLALAARHFPKDDGVRFDVHPLHKNGTDCAHLDSILQDFRPDVLRLPGTLLPTEAFTETRLKGIRRILFPFLDPSEIAHDRAAFLPVLDQIGFTEDTSGEPNGSLFLRRE